MVRYYILRCFDVYTGMREVYTISDIIISSEISVKRNLGVNLTQNFTLKTSTKFLYLV